MSDFDIDQEYMEKYKDASWMETHTGRKFYPADPKAGDLTVLDIAHALSLKCRYGGHTIGHYSVAEHCVVLALHARKLGLPSSTQLHLLAHDASEAYLPDVPRPIKHFFPDLIRMEKRLDAMIRGWAGLSFDVPPVVKEWDSRIIKDERARYLFRSQNDWQTDSLEELDVGFPGFTAEQAEAVFLQLWQLLGREVTGKNVMLGYGPGMFMDGSSSDVPGFVPPDIRVIDLLGSCALAVDRDTHKPYFLHADFNFAAG